GRGGAVRADALAEGRDAAGGAEVVRDLLAVEPIGRQLRLGRLERERRARERREQAAAAPAHRAVAVVDRRNLALHLERDPAAVAAALVGRHGVAPRTGRRRG